MKNNNVTLKVSTKNNITRNITNTFNRKFMFGDIDRLSIDLYLYPNTLAMEIFVDDFISIQSAMNEGKKKVIAAAAVDIRKQIK